MILLRDEVTGTIRRPNYRFYASTYNAGTVANKVERFYYVDGKAVGGVGNDGPSRTDYAQALANRGAPQGNNAGWQPIGSADFDQNYEPISPIYPGSVSTTYLVKNGDTLQSIASSVWGDSAMWYLIADANGLASGSSLVAGQVLTIPNKVANINNNAGTFRPYNPGEAIGDTSPTLPVAPSPPKKKKKCGGFLAIIVAVISIAVTVATGGNAILGNLAGQLAGNILGVQKGFDFKSFATSALTYGLGKIDAIKSFTTSFGNGVGNAVGGGSFGNYANIAAQAVVGNITNQAVGNITGAQKGFSWSSVAVAGIGAGVGASISKQFGLTDALGQPASNSIGNDLGRAAVGAGAFALTQVAVRGGKINWQQVATDTILNFAQNRGESIAQQKAINKWVDGLSAEEKGAYMKATAADPRTVNNLQGRDRYLDMYAARGTTDTFIGEKRYGEQKDLLGTSPSAGGLSIKEGVAENVKNNAQSTNNANAINKANLGGVDQAISNIVADAVGQYYVDEQAKVIGLALQNAAKEEHDAYRLYKAKTLNLETLATDRGESFGQSGVGLKPYVSGPSFSTWDKAGDRAAALQSERTRSGVALAAGGPLTLTALAVGSPVLATTAGIGGLTGGSFDYAGQYFDTKGFTTGQWRPAQTAFATITGGLFAPYAVNFKFLGNVGLGSGVSVLNAGANNWLYRNDATFVQKDWPALGWEALKGGVAGGSGYIVGGFTTGLLTKPINPNISILFQNYNNPYPFLVGSTVGGAVSGSVPIAADKTKDYLFKDKSN